MVKFFTSAFGAALLTLAGQLALGAIAPASSAPRGLAPVLTFDDLAYQRGKVMLRKVIITEMDADQKVTMRVQADVAEATGMDFDDSSWNFNGQVVVTLPEGELHADHALVGFKRGRISTATVDGAPATFAQQAGADEPPAAGSVSGARGRATQISYDVVSGEIHLTGDAWISDDAREINSQRIVYSIPLRSVRADSDAVGGERVRGTIRPRARPPATGNAARTGPAP